MGDYEGLAAVGRSAVQPFFVTTANAPADLTDVYSGILLNSDALSVPHAATPTPKPKLTALQQTPRQGKTVRW